MDLLQTVRKEGSRGGRSEFKWEDVKNSGHRENYLGHSLMAPVGRWQKGKDLNWYANKNTDGTEMSEEDARKEEIRRVKQAEEVALAKALGIELPEANANMTVLGGDGGNSRMLKGTAEIEDTKESDTRPREDKRERRHHYRSHRHRRHREPSSRSRSRSRHRHRRSSRSRSRSQERRRGDEREDRRSMDRPRREDTERSKDYRRRSRSPRRERENERHYRRR